jgi:poly-gamma-glutamate synthesis protein (capsule biosynthesis protein)
VSDFNDSRYDHDRSGFPADREIWEAVVALPTWQGKRLTELALHPISLGFGKGRLDRGRPVLANRETGQKILDDLIARSAPFNTRITIRDGVGYVDLGQTSNE